jgi:hypothetical protein
LSFRRATPLSVAGAFAAAVKTYGFPSYGDGWGFVVGGVVAFVGLSIVARGRLAEAPVQLPTGLLALANVGFPLAGLVGAGGYVFLVSVFFWGVARTQADRLDRLNQSR